MTDTTKEATKPKKLSLRRKLGVVAGLVVFAILAMWWLAISYPRPSPNSLKRVHDWVQERIENGPFDSMEARRHTLIRESNVLDLIGDADENVELVPMNRKTLGLPAPDRQATWNQFDSSTSTHQELRIGFTDDGLAVHARYSCEERSWIGYLYEERIVPFIFSVQ